MTDRNQPHPDDRTIKCRDCSESFTFTKGEQDFFASREPPLSPPTRCKPCRQARKAQQQGGGFAPSRPQQNADQRVFSAAPAPKPATYNDRGGEVDVFRRRPNPKKQRRRDKDEDY